MKDIANTFQTDECEEAGGAVTLQKVSCWPKGQKQQLILNGSQLLQTWQSDFLAGRGLQFGTIEEEV